MKELVDVTNLGTPSEPWFVRRKELIPASTERVWRALTVAAELQEWWCDEARLELHTGGLYLFGGPHAFFGAPSGDGQPDPPGNFEIVDLEEGSRLTYRWWLAGVETRVTYELTGVLESTELAVTQVADRNPFTGWPCVAEGSDSETPNWWWLFLPALRTYLEKGRTDLRPNFDNAAQASRVQLQTGFSTFPWVIWNKLTEPQELERWWAKPVQLELSPGGVFHLGRGCPGPQRIIECENETRLVHDWCWNDQSSTRVEWTIKETDDDTLVRVTDCSPWDPGTQNRFAVVFWAAVLLNLKQVSERGIAPQDHQRH